jgi:hypothetical protein
MTTTEKIAGLERRIEQVRLQMNRLLQVAIDESQKRAVTLGHQMTIEEFQSRIDALKAGQPDPFE